MLLSKLELSFGAVQKRHLQSGGLVQCGHLANKGVLQIWPSRTVFGSKNFRFFKFMLSPHGQRGSIFRDFVRTSFI